MIKVLFVCYGNICRSTMAEFLFKKFVKEKGKEQEFYIQSAATSDEEVGNPVHIGTRKILEREGINCAEKRARQITKEDYKNFDYIIGMDDKNIRALNRFYNGDVNGKIYKLLDFTADKRDVIDPWFLWLSDGVGDFESTYRDIMAGINGFYDFLSENKLLKG